MTWYQDDLYHEVILTEYQHPQNFGELSTADIGVQHRNASCGDQVTVYLKLDKKKNKIVEVGWQGNGCALSQAATSILLQDAKGLPLTQAKKITRQHLQSLLGLEKVSISREKCLTLGFEAFHKAVNTLVTEHQLPTDKI